MKIPARALAAVLLVGLPAPALPAATFAAEPAQAQEAAAVVLSPTRYDLRFDVDYAAEVLRATVRIELQNPSERPVPRVSLLLYRLMQVRSVRSDQGRELPFEQAAVLFEDRKLQVNQILVTLPQPLAPGSKTAIEIQYDGHLLGYAETGMLYVKDRIDPEFTILREDSYCYPQPGFPSRVLRRASVPKWKFSYGARVTVPRGLIVANGGRLDGTDPAGDRVTFRYSSLKPSYRMDFAIAKYGELSGAGIRAYYLPGDAAGAAAVVEAAGKALDLFGRWFGPTPQASAFAFIEIPDGWGSQTDVTTIIQTAAAFKDPRKNNEVFHEISHLWNPPDTDLPSPRWNEGLATFLEHLADQELSGRPAVDQRAAKVLNWLREKLPARPELRKTALIDYGRNDMTDFSYSVGALFFDLLYRLAGGEGFNRIIRDYVAEHGVRGGSTRDLVEIARRDSPGVPQQLYDDWLFTTAWTGRVEKSTGIEDLVAHYKRRPPGTASTSPFRALQASAD